MEEVIGAEVGAAEDTMEVEGTMAVIDVDGTDNVVLKYCMIIQNKMLIEFVQ